MQNPDDRNEGSNARSGGTAFRFFNSDSPTDSEAGTF